MILCPNKFGIAGNLLGSGVVDCRVAFFSCGMVRGGQRVVCSVVMVRTANVEQEGAAHKGARIDRKRVRRGMDRCAFNPSWPRIDIVWRRVEMCSPRGR